jgi:hypothetical protein
MVAGISIARVHSKRLPLPTVARPEDFAPCGRSPSQGAFSGESRLILVFRDEVKMRLLRLRRDWKNHSTGHAAYRTDFPRSHRHPDFPSALAITDFREVFDHLKADRYDLFVGGSSISRRGALHGRRRC